MEDLGVYVFSGIIFILLLVFIGILLQSQNYWHRNGIAQIQPHLIFGHIRPYLFENADFGSLLRDLYNDPEADGQRYVGLYMVHRPALLVRDPAAVNQFLQASFTNFSTREFHSGIERCLLSDNIYQRSGIQWKEDREFFAKAFSPQNVASMYETYGVMTPLERYLDNCSDSGSYAIHAYKLVERHLYNVFAWAIYGVHVNCISYSEESFRTFGIDLFRPKFVEKLLFLRNYVVPISWKRLINLLNVRRHSKRIEDFYVSLTKHSLGRRECHQKEWNASKDYMQYLLKIRTRGFLYVDETGERIEIEPKGT